MQMSFILKILVFILILPCAYLIYLSLTAVRPVTELVDGKLRPCPGNPNCVCSEYKGRFHTNPLNNGQGDLNLTRLAKIIDSMDGHIEAANDAYIRASFTTKVFRFLDDLEIRLDPDQQIIHVRSESRSGRSDFGVNRKRIESLRQYLLNQI
jgi:uncharacterized protein (DUF1499 family)